MATMSYCAIENTADDLEVVMEKLDSISSIDELSQYEQRSVERFRSLAKDALAALDELGEITNGE